MISNIIDMNKEIKLFNADCLDICKGAKNIKSKSIDLICCDLPYGTTQNKWDAIIPLKKMWSIFKRVIKPTGMIVLTASQPFTSHLIMSAPKGWFKYDTIWEKTMGSCQLLIHKRPLRKHEDILIFSPTPLGRGVYNPIYTQGTPYTKRTDIIKDDNNYGIGNDIIVENEGVRCPKSIITVANPRIKGGHPTEKPVKLMEYLIKTYSNENDTVLDITMGSGTTGVASVNLNRKFIGIELDTVYFDRSKMRIETAVRGSSLIDSENEVKKPVVKKLRG